MKGQTLLARYQHHLLEAGCDEAGRGCLAGPVFAAAVILPPDFHHPALNDSKQLDEDTRNQLRPEIEKTALAFAVACVDNVEIDEINILNASILAMHRAVEKLLLPPGFLIIDGNRFKKYPSIDHACIVKGDSKYFSIAAASVLAKTYRDDYMKQLAEEYPEYHWHQNKGYPTKKHRSVILEKGFTPYHRLTFRVSDPLLDALADSSATIS
ncbi:ribonuclease HII [Mucilaginibacter arboris]|uniref:Ribonuclease HII n=1 Tax=Mucilaginibacter arboris TaxID=2682090 RepID=A0A7K1SRK4_9SPHI|nr:ribonuclease HII [Mucilaginibacter arboris]MVN19931.1 ribonuclease HII [Mucilaginibacter arboris]